MNFGILIKNNKAGIMLRHLNALSWLNLKRLQMFLIHLKI